MPVMRIGIEMPDNTAWLVCSYDDCMNGVFDSLRLFQNESDARAVFEEYIRDLRGDPADANHGNWIGERFGEWRGDDGFVVMSQMKIE
jgi:hypothetical protein